MISVLIPRKNEKYLDATISDLKAKAEGVIEILTEEDYDLGQRALTNKLCKMAKYDYVMKVDAHCCFSKGWDTELLRVMKENDDNVIVAPRLLSIDVKDWRPVPPRASSYCFDTDLVMQYNREAENDEPVNETMCLQGSCWLISKKNYWDWNVCEESLGNWGFQGAELGIKAWLGGGRCLTTKLAHYGHLFRQNETDFPYERDLDEIKEVGERIRAKYKNKDIAGLIKKYNYPADWDILKVRDLV